MAKTIDSNQDLLLIAGRSDHSLKKKNKKFSVHLLMAARLLIALKWKTGFEMGIVQKQTNPHSLDGDDEQKKWLPKHTPRKMEDKKIMRYFVTFYFGVKQNTFTKKTKTKTNPKT